MRQGRGDFDAFFGRRIAAQGERGISQNSEFFHALFEPEAGVPSAFSHPQKDQEATARFSIYRNNVVVSLKQNLADGFPLLLSLLGGEAFDALADAFVRAHPPRSPLMFAYVEALPDFLGQFPPFAELPYAVDVARLELAMRKSAHAKDVMAGTDLHLHDADAQGLQMAPCVQLVTSVWPLYDLWLFLQDRAEAPEDMSLGQSLLVYRTPDYEIELACLPPDGAAFIMALLDGKSLSAAVSMDPEKPLSQADATTLLTRLMEAGLVTAMRDVKPETKKRNK
jgi:hypothetical protein